MIDTVSVSQERKQHEFLFNDESVLFECPASITAVTDAVENWYDVSLRLRKNDIVCYRWEIDKSKKPKQFFMHAIPLQHIQTIMMNPDNYELRLLIKAVRFTNTGWFTLRFESQTHYDTIIEILQARCIEQFSHFVWEYKTPYQDFLHGLVPTDKLSANAVPTLIQREWKHGNAKLTYRVLLSKWFR